MKMKILTKVPLNLFANFSCTLCEKKKKKKGESNISSLIHTMTSRKSAKLKGGNQPNNNCGPPACRTCPS